jgi:hypothetical protein
MMIVVAACSVIAFLLLTPESALAWGPVTHIALGVQVLATVITPDHPLQATIANLPEVFLYGSLAPDIVQGRRLQSRLRRHSHNWATGLDLLSAARGAEQTAFALGYLAHLAGDIVAHNFFLPARFIGGFDSRIASHIYCEARFDTFHDRGHRELMLKVIDADYRPLNRMLKRAIDSPLVSFSAHRAVFEGGLKRIRELYRVMEALGGPDRSERVDVDLFSSASCASIAGVLGNSTDAPAYKFDPMGEQAIKSALTLRSNLRRLVRLGPQAHRSARSMAETMVADLRAHLRESTFAAPSTA